MTSRRKFLRLAAGGAVAAAVPWGCGSSTPESPRTAAKGSANGGKRPTLRIAQWYHLHPGYDGWLDSEYVKRWGDEHDADVVVDHLPYGQLLTRADIEVRERRGHDMFAFPIGLPVRFEDAVIDHRDIVEEARRRVGPMTPSAERSVRNAKTGKYFGFMDWFSGGPAIYRSDVWATTGLKPTTWADVLRAAPALKAAGHPIGIGMAPEGDAQITLCSILFCYGASIQDEEGKVAIGRPATVEAVKVVAEIYRKGMTPEVLEWKDPVSDNRAILSGQASLILDPISSIRASETQNPALAPKLAIAPGPAGPAGAFEGGAMHTYFVWQFAEQRELAEQFLVDLVTDYREPFLRSGFYNLPAFPGGLKDIREILAADAAADPKGKYSPLAVCADRVTNPGYPGHDNVAIEEVVNQYIVPKMFGAAARGDMSAEAAVREAAAQVKQIFDKWRGEGKL
jgi:multiple sugar transport system substrate-binding protein